MSIFFDLRQGSRRLRRYPGFTTLATLCLGIGIGASVGVFSVLNTLLLHPLPGVDDPAGLVTLSAKPVPVPGMPGATMYMALSYPTYLRYREASRSFSGLAAYEEIEVNLAVPGSGRPLRVSGHVATSNYFSILGLRSATGRTLADLRGPGERQTGVLLSEGLRRRLFGTRRDVLGRTLLLNGRVFQVAGVLPEGFRGVDRLEPVDVWISLEAAPLAMPSMTEGKLRDPAHAWLGLFFARLAPGVDVAKAQTELDAIARIVAEDGPRSRPVPALEVAEGVGIYPALRHQVVKPLMILSVVATLLMLLVCANLAGLLLTQAAAREKEIGVRVAFGATQGRILQQLLSESVLLGLLGGIAGVALGRALVKAIEGVALDGFLPELTGLALDSQALTFALGLALAAGLLFGLAPALWMTQAQWIREGAGTTQRRPWLQEVFVVGQVALSLTLLVGTGLFVRTWQNLQDVPHGFESRGVMNFRIDLELQRFGRAEGLAFYDRLLEGVRGLPGVRAASLAASAPLGSPRGPLLFSHLQVPGSAEPQTAAQNTITPGYFKTLGIPLLGGRDFAESDGESSPPVAIVSQALARKLWPGESPVGKHLTMDGTAVEIVGMAGDVRTSLEGDPDALLYRPLRQVYFPNLVFHVKTTGDPRSLVAPVRAQVRRLDRHLPLVDVAPYKEEVRQASAQSLLFSTLLGSASGVALLLTGIGLYGTLAFAVRRRTREMGIRRALGARTSEILGLVLRRGLALTGLGLALGTLVSWMATRGLANELFGVTPTDPAVFTTVLLVCGTLGAAASLLPAWSAARVDPMKALRQE